MRVFIGLNVSLAKTAVCFVDHDGAVQWQGKVPSEPGPLIKRLAESHGMIELAGIEARPLSEWLHLGPREAGIPIVCVETRHAQRFLSSRPVKTDKNDACGIAEMMRLGHYRPVHVKSPAGAADAHDPRRPHAIWRAQLQIEGMVRGSAQGLRPQDRGDAPQPFRGPRARTAQDGRPDGIVGSPIEPLLRVREGMRTERKGFDRTLASAAGARTSVRRLMTIPGIGPVTTLPTLLRSMTPAASAPRKRSAHISA